MRLEEEYADRIKQAAGQVSEERARTFVDVLTSILWDSPGRGLLDLESVRFALAASDDPEVIGLAVEHLEDLRISDGNELP